ncbi:hypothetical protein pb186bvf_017288 [Paramecium bursaria]
MIQEIYNKNDDRMINFLIRCRILTQFFLKSLQITPLDYHKT